MLLTLGNRCESNRRSRVWSNVVYLRLEQPHNGMMLRNCVKYDDVIHKVRAVSHHTACAVN